MPKQPAKRGRGRPRKASSGKTMKVTKTVRVPKLRDDTKAGVLSVVRQILARNIENKRIGFNVEKDVLHNSGIGPGDCEALVGQIQPIGSAGGANSSQMRIGDKIKPKVLRVHGILTFNKDASMTNIPIYVRVILASQKDIKLGSAITNANQVATNSLLHPGILGADEVPFNGNTVECTYPINKNKFRVYMDKQFTLSSGNVTVTGYPNEERMHSQVRWSYTFTEKELPASLTYDATAGNWANNFAPFVAIGYAYCNGTSPDTAGQHLYSTVTSILDFEDA